MLPCRAQVYSALTILFVALVTHRFGGPFYGFAVSMSSNPDSSSTIVLQSQCHCQQVVVEIQLPLSTIPKNRLLPRVVNCHCRSCRRHHTAAHVSYFILREQEQNKTDKSIVSIRQGQDKIGKLSSKCKEFGDLERWYCTDCSSKLMSVATTLDVHADAAVPPATKYLINLGPMDESSIPNNICQHWKAELKLPKNNVQLDQASRWHGALPPKRMQQNVQSNAQWLGGCSCGACQYRITIPEPTELQHCYCQMCRKLSGGPFMTWMPVENRYMEWVDESQNDLQLMRTTPFGQRHVCKKCHSVMTIVYDDQPEYTWPCAGGLDDESLPETFKGMEMYLSRVCHICCRYLPGWMNLPDDGMERIADAS
jgi:hypothetical protein